MKVIKKSKFILFFILWIINSTSFIIANKLELQISNKAQNQKYYDNPSYVLPHINKEPDMILQHRSVIPLHQPILQSGIHHRIIQQPSCPCAAQMACKPCGLMGNSIDLEPHIDCPCAPRPRCPICPPLSLIHEIASKKVYL